MTTEETKVKNYFKELNANLNINLSESQGIYEYLYGLIQEDVLEIPDFELKAYSCSQFDDTHTIHNFYFEQTHYIDSEFIMEYIASLPIMEQDYSQPSPFYTIFFGDLYITIIAEA